MKTIRAFLAAFTGNRSAIKRVATFGSLVIAGIAVAIWAIRARLRRQRWVAAKAELARLKLAERSTTELSEAIARASERMDAEDAVADAFAAMREAEAKAESSMKATTPLTPTGVDARLKEAGL